MPRYVDAVVWVADTQVADGLDYGVRLVEQLEARGLRVKSQSLTNPNGHTPAADLHLISGGGTSVNDQSGWMRRGLALTRSLVDGARRGDHTVLGVCLGSQMVAEVRWPGCVRRGKQIEVGLTEVAWHPRDGRHELLVVPAFHYEEVDRPTAEAGGADIVAENAHSGVQGLRFGERLWGVQFHPELEPADVRRLVMYHRHTIEAHHHTVEDSLRTVDQLEPAWNRAVFNQILDQVTAR